MSAKQALRIRMKRLLEAMTEEERVRQSRLVFNKLKAEEWFVRAKRVGLYVSLKLEVDTKEIISHAFNEGKHVFVPRYSVTDRYMDLLRVESVTDVLSLPETKWGVRQPSMDDQSRDNALQTGLDVLIVPGLAFSRDGARLGKGGGFYDRFLSRLKRDGWRPLVVGLAFTQQVIDAQEIPLEPTDERIDRVVSP